MLTLCKGFFLKRAISLLTVTLPNRDIFLSMATATSTTTTGTSETDYISSLRHLTRNQLAQIADDTLRKLRAGFYCTAENEQIDLREDIAFSINNSVLYTEDDLHGTRRSTKVQEENIVPHIEVRLCTTLQAAESLATETEENRVGILNFASAKNPGGGFLRGSSAQEESIARSSSLYLALTECSFSKDFYEYNRRGRNPIYSNRIIYSPRVTVFKDDNGTLLPAPYRVGIVTVPAPNASVARDAEAIREAMTDRIRRLLMAFEIHQHDTLVLGAFGCGVFKNDPVEVATIFQKYLQSDQFNNSFKRIVFAIYNHQMYEIFRRVFALAGPDQALPQTAVTSRNDDERSKRRGGRKNKN